jgi:peptide/nickel transport system substrate-binding protein
MKRLLISGLIIAFVLALPAGFGRAEEQPKQGGVLTVGVQRDLIMMNPLVSTLSTERAIRELMYEPILTSNPDGKLVPKLAESWEVSTDGKMLTFKIRKGVKFHNGQDLSARDVKFSIDYTMNPKNGAYGKRFFDLVERVETTDRSTLKVYLKKASPGFVASLATIQALSIVPIGSLQEGVDKPTQYPPGTGAFRFAEWKPQQQIIFERFDQYWGHKPFIDKLILRPIRDETVRFTALRAGDVDIVERAPYEWVKQIKDGKLKGLGLSEARTGSWRIIMFNVADPPFNNKRLRQAVAYAINKKEILHAAFFGFGVPVDQRYPDGHQWHVNDLPAYSYQPEKARSLLKEAGYKGEIIKITVEQSQIRETEAITLQAQLKKIGMNIELNVMERGSFVSAIRKGDFSLVTYGGSTKADPFATYADLMCGRDTKRRTENLSGYCDREMESLLPGLESELDAAKRMAIYRRVVTKVEEDLPEIALGFVPRYFAFRNYVKGFTTDDEGLFIWSNGGMNYVWIDK